ncbi:uncharacterized protein LOC128729113 [Anopheles nili]|uniref:uncharacterized protein LOC128729113 n=1 Tax=Anopheles nili TaxID=185578 RepID=UPI00237BE4D0|nr:uncharacterized protein LOC128729113 [Anopheles nili]
MEAFINEMVEPRVFDLLVLIQPKWKLLVYVFLMNIVIFTPVYVYGALLSNDSELDLICPPVMLIGFSLVHRSLFYWNNEQRSTPSLLSGVAILCLGISASGLVAMHAPHYILEVLLYSVVGGFGYQLVYSRMWKLLAKIFNAKKEMFVIKFLHSCGQATSLLLLLVVFLLPWEDYIYGAMLLLLAGVILHLIPLVLLIKGEKRRLQNDQDALVRLTEKGNELYYARVATRTVSEVESASCSEHPDSDFERTPVTWKNPANFSKPIQDLQPEPIDEPRLKRTQSTTEHLDFEFEECEDASIFRRDGKCFNQDGVEILEVIIEEDESTLAAYDVRDLEVRQDELSSTCSLSDPVQVAGKWRWLSQLWKAVTGSYQGLGLDFRLTVNLRLIESTRSALGDLRCCSSALLKATDACIFTLFLAILPRFTAYHYQQRTQSRYMTLLAMIVIASAWIGSSFLLLCCELRFRKQQERLLVFGLLFEAFGYFCVYAIKSSFWTIAGCVLIGTGHSIACSYQKTVLKRQLGQRRWANAKTGIELLSGIAVLIIAVLANLIYIYGRVDRLLLLLLLIYSAASALWMACSCRIFFS